MAKKTILVVDDEPNSLFVTSQLLSCYYRRKRQFSTG